MTLLATDIFHVARAFGPQTANRYAATARAFCLLLLLLLTGLEGRTQTSGTKIEALYEITDLGPTLRSTDDITPTLDQSGRAVTWVRDHDFVVHTSLHERGKKTDLGALPGYPDTYAADINAGRVVGTSRASADTRYYRAFLWQNGQMEDLGTLGGKYGRAYAVNPKGQVVGGANTTTNETHAFLRDARANSQLRDLGTLAQGNYSLAYGINRACQVIGVANVTPNGKNHAFLWANEQMRDLGMLPGGAFGHARAINDRGQVVGWGNDADGDTHAILWHNGRVQDLGVLVTDPSSAWAINNRGQVVGASAIRANRPLHAVMWDNAKIRDLNDLIPAGSGWQLQGAYRINDRGQIVGIGLFHDVIHTYLLTPSTQPSKQATQPRSAGAGNASAAADPPHQMQQTRSTEMPQLNRAAPPFSLPDMDGHAHSLAEFSGKSVALFFFCGCERCQRCARTWAELQHSGALAPATSSERATTADTANPRSPVTLVVFTGDADAARDFARDSGLDLSQTVLLPDPKMDVTNTYHVLPCPRVFVLDAKQTVRYVNLHVDDDPLKATASTIDTRALEAIHRIGKREEADTGKREEGRGNSK